MTRVYRLTVMVVDHDKLGPDEVRIAVESTRCAGRYASLQVADLEERTIEWSDDHPLNQREGWRPAFDELFRAAPRPGRPVDLDRLERLARVATPGERSIEQDRNEQWCVYAQRSDGRDWIALLPHQCVVSTARERERDAQLLEATSPEVVTELVRRIREAERVVDLAVEHTPVSDEAVGSGRGARRARQALWVAAREAADRRGE